MKRRKVRCIECNSYYRVLYTINPNVSWANSAKNSWYLCKKCRRRYLRESPHF